MEQNVLAVRLPESARAVRQVHPPVLGTAVVVADAAVRNAKAAVTVILMLIK